MEFIYDDLQQLLEQNADILARLPTIMYPLGKVAESVALKSSSRMVELYEAILANINNTQIVISCIEQSLENIKRDLQLIRYMFNEQELSIYFPDIEDKASILEDLNAYIIALEDIINILIELSKYIENSENVIKMFNYLVGFHSYIFFIAKVLQSLSKKSTILKGSQEQNENS